MNERIKERKRRGWFEKNFVSWNGMEERKRKKRGIRKWI